MSEEVKAVRARPAKQAASQGWSGGGGGGGDDDDDISWQVLRIVDTTTTYIENIVKPLAIER